MKKSLLILISFFASLIVMAQAPETFSYQAVVRDALGNVVVTQPVSFQISIISGSALGTVEYVETHAVTTNVFGLVTMPVGTGTVVSGDFSLIEWGSNLHFIKVEADITGGSSYVDMGTVRLLSVPYALYAKKAANGFSGDYNDLSNAPDFTGWDQDSTNDFSGDYNSLFNRPDFTNWDTDSTNDFNGDYNNLTNLPDFTNWDQDVSNDFDGSYNNLTNKPVLIGDVTGDLDNNTVEKIRGMNISPVIPANGQILKWNNTTQIWEPSEDQLGAAGTTDGVVIGASFTGTTTKTLTLIRSNGLGDISATFTDNVGDADADPANELQTLNLTNDNLSISAGNTVSLSQYHYTAGSGINITGNQIVNTEPNQEVTISNGSGISVTGTYPDFTVTNTLPDQPVTLTGSGSTTVTGTYPNYTITSTDNNTEYVAGTAIDIQGNQIINLAPDQAVTLTGSGATTITGTYPNFTITSTDNVNDADASPTNEIQSLSIAGNDLTISGGNTVVLPQSTYTAGSGINISGNTVSNTAPDQVVTISNGTGISVSGAYPGYTVTNTSPDQSVSLTGGGSTTVTGTYPSFTITSTDNNTTYSAGTGIGLTGTTINNTAPDQTVTLTGSGASTVSGTYPNFTVSSTDNNTTYDAGTGMTLSGTTFDAQTTNALWNANQLQGVGVSNLAPLNGQILKYDGTNWIPAADNNTTYSASTGLTLTGTSFSHNAHTGDASGATALTVTGIQGRVVSTNIPANGQVLKWNSTSSKWEPNDDALGAAGTNDGVVTSVAVTGTTNKTITLTRSESLGDLTATFTDEGSVYTAGSGIDITGNTVSNTAPDQTVTLTGSGAATVSGTYPNFNVNSVNTTYSAGTGMNLTGTTFNAQTTNALWNANQLQGVVVNSAAPSNDQVLKYNGTNWAPAADNNTSYSAGTGINITGTTITNTAPDQTMVLTGNGATTVSGTYPSFTVSSTDNNTTYTAGTGLSLTGTQFSNTQTLAQTLTNGNTAGTNNIDMNSQDISNVDVLALRSDNAAYIDMYYGHIYDYAGSHGVAGQALIVRGTSPNTWVRWESPSGFLTAGTGIGISGSTITNSAPDQTVVLNGGGATTISGTYPSFTISSVNSGGTVTSIATSNGISGGTITSTGTLVLTGQASALHNLATNGIIARTGAGAVAARTLTGSTGIQVTNGDGVSGNPTLTPVFGSTAGTISEGTHTHGTYGVAGTNGMVQFNNSGAFGGVQGFIWDNTNSRLMLNGATTTGQQSNLVIRQTTNPVNSTRDSVILANLGLDIRQNAATSYYGSGLKFTVGNASTYTGTAAIYAERTGGWSSGDLHFAVCDAGVTDKTALPIRMTIKNTGKVGIGTTTPTAQLEVQSIFTSPTAVPLFEIKNKAGQPIFVVYEDSVRIFIDDDPAKENKGAFAVSGRNTAKAFTNNFLWIAPDSSRVYTGDVTKGFGVRNINGTNLESYMKVTPGNTIVGLLAGNSLTNGMYNTMIGYKAGTNTTGGIITYPDFNGSYNIFVGYEAGRNNVTGGMNVFVGNYAGQLATSGVKNTCVGNQSMQANTTGGYNSAFGYNSGIQTTGSENSFYGADVAFYNTTGSFNAYYGSHTGEYFNGGYNTFIGAGAGRNASTVRTGNYNIFIGSNAGSASGSVSNKLYIDPTNTNTPLIEGDFSTNSVEINGNLCYTGTFGTCSDIRYKKDFEPLANSLEKIMQINGYYYHWKYDEFPEMVFSQGRQLGVIAQDVEKLFPELISENEQGYKMVDYARLTPVIIEAIKDQQKQIEDLKNENNKLKGIASDVEDLARRCSELEKQLGATSQK